MFNPPNMCALQCTNLFIVSMYLLISIIATAFYSPLRCGFKNMQDLAVTSDDFRNN